MIDWMNEWMIEWIKTGKQDLFIAKKVNNNLHAAILTNSWCPNM